MSRSTWKPINTIKEIIDTESAIYIKDRSILITPFRIGKQLKVFNGIRWYTIQVVEDKVNHLLGEFAQTCKRPTVKKKSKIKKNK